jgi:hypothetical protein
MEASQPHKPFDLFELCAALLLGLAAIGAAVASHQAGLWGGQSVEGYGESAAMTTRASTTYNDELITYIQDTQVDTRAKELIWEALEIRNAERADRLKHIASWLYVSQLSDPAYAALKLPKLNDEGSNAGIEGVNEDENGFTFTDEVLQNALNTNLGERYVKEVFAPSEADFDAADQRFDAGRLANSTGDQFSLAVVILTVALFFGGLALVFKTSMRWGFLGLGTAVLFGGLGFMATLNWA